MIVGFIAGVTFSLFLMGIMNKGKAVEVDDYNEGLIETGKQDRKLISNLQSELDLPDHKRMEISEDELQNLRSKLERSLTRNNILRDEIKLLNSFITSMRNEREA